MTERPKKWSENIVLGFLIALWGVALMIFGPFYARGYPVPRSIGIFFVIFGIGWIILEVFAKRKKNNHNAKK